MRVEEPGTQMPDSPSYKAAMRRLATAPPLAAVASRMCNITQNSDSPLKDRPKFCTQMRSNKSYFYLPTYKIARGLDFARSFHANILLCIGLCQGAHIPRQAAVPGVQIKVAHSSLLPTASGDHWSSANVAGSLFYLVPSDG